MRPADDRLSDGDDEIAAALREIRRVPPPTPGQQSAAWRRLSAPPRHGGAWWVAAAAVAAAAVLFASARRDRGDGSGAVATFVRPEVGAPSARRASPVAAAPTASSSAPASPRVAARLSGSSTPPHPLALEPAQPRLALAVRPRPLPVGPAALADEATVELASGAVARASADDAFVRVVLARGQVSLHVGKRTFGGPGFEVAAGPYRFRVLGTRFRVARSVSTTGRVELWVEEGRVAVSGGGRELGIVEAGGYWAGRATRAVPRPAVAAREAASDGRGGRVGQDGQVDRDDRVGQDSEDEEDAAPERSHRNLRGAVSARTLCAELAASAATARDAVTCYLASADSDGVASETALFEAGRLRRDALGDPAGALESFQLYRARFPRGLLRAEADLSIIELLPKLNRHREALDEIGRVLANGGGQERTSELLFMRANIYREVLEDFARAERDYAAVEAVQAPAVGDATFFRGVCLQAAGRADEARAAFERYLAARPGRFADEARRRLARLAR